MSKGIRDIFGKLPFNGRTIIIELDGSSVNGYITGFRVNIGYLKNRLIIRSIT